MAGPSAASGPADAGGGNAGIGTGNAASLALGFGGDGGPSSTGDQHNMFGSGAKNFNFNAPARAFTDTTFGKGAAIGLLVLTFILAAAWVRKH